MFKVIKVLVLLNDGADDIILSTDLPPSMPNISNQNLIVQFNTQKDTGVEYVRKNFGIEPEVISSRGPLYKFDKKYGCYGYLNEAR